MVTESRSVVAWGQRWGGVWDSGMDYKWAWGNFGDDGYVHYLVCADDFTVCVACIHMSDLIHIHFQ